MTTTPCGTPRDEEPDEDDGSVQPEHHTDSESLKDRMQSTGGMSLSRFEEISDADERGEPLDLSDEERAEYEATKASISQTMASFQRTMMEPYQAINARLQEIVRGAIRPIKFDMPPIKLPDGLIPKPRDLSDISDLHVPMPPAPTTLVTEDDLEAMAEASRERDEVQTQIRKHTFETAAAMKAMLDEMEKEAVRLQDQADTDTRRWWWVFGVAIGSMIFAGMAAVPVLIELWKAFFGE